MKKSSIIILVVVIIAVAGGITYWVMQSSPYEPLTTPPAVTSTPPSPVQTSTPILDTATSATLGTYLTAPNGMTLYTSSNDTNGVSNCTGACATSWPPYTIAASSPLVAGANINGVIGVISHGLTVQITYNGKPLYFWVNDSAPGDTTGQSINGFVVAKP